MNQLNIKENACITEQHYFQKQKRMEIKKAIRNGECSS